MVAESERANCRAPRLARCVWGRLRRPCGLGLAFVASVLAAPFAFGVPKAARAPLAARPAAAAWPGAQAEGARASGGWTPEGRLTGRFSPQAIDRFSPPGAEGARGSSWRRPVGFAGLGVGAALLGAGLYSSVRLTGVEGQWSEPSLLAYRSTLPPTQDSCEAARRGVLSPQAGAANPSQVRGLCAQVSTFETLQYAFFGAGALVGGLGALFLLSTAPPREAPGGLVSSRRAPPPRPSWRLQPSFARSTATLTLHVRFH